MLTNVIMRMLVLLMPSAQTQSVGLSVPASMASGVVLSVTTSTNVLMVPIIVTRTQIVKIQKGPLNVAVCPGLKVLEQAATILMSV